MKIVVNNHNFFHLFLLNQAILVVIVLLLFYFMEISEATTGTGLHTTHTHKHTLIWQHDIKSLPHRVKIDDSTVPQLVPGDIEVTYLLLPKGTFNTEISNIRTPIAVVKHKRANHYTICP